MVFASLEIRSISLKLSNKNKSGDRVFIKILENSGGSVVFLIYSFLVFYIQIMWFVFYLTIFHSYLIINNTTTNEHLKKIWKNPPSNPFNYKNIIKNIASVIFKPKIPAHFDMQRPLDLNMDCYTISPSKIAFVQTPRTMIKHEKMRSDGETSPFIFDLKDDGELDKDPRIVPEKI
jgi:hypothetical protein